MSNTKTARRAVYVVLAVLLAADAAAAVVLLSPLLHFGFSRQSDFQLVRRQLEAKKKTVIPPQEMQQRVEEARQQIDKFYQQRLPAEASAITVRLGATAAKSGVHLLQARYDTGEPDASGLRPVHIDASLRGDYLQEVKFINSLERDPMFFIVDRVSLGEDTGGQTRLQVSVQTFLKGESAP